MVLIVNSPLSLVILFIWIFSLFFLISLSLSDSLTLYINRFAFEKAYQDKEDKVKENNDNLSGE